MMRKETRKLSTRKKAEVKSTVKSTENIKVNSTDKNDSKNAQATQTIKLNAVMDISQVSQLQKEWVEKLTGPAIIIDASAVEKIDTASLQLICSLYQAVKSKKIDISTKENSEAMDNAIKLLGLNKLLNVH